MNFNNFTSDWFLSILHTISQNNIPPTIASRFLFLSANIIYDSRRTILNQYSSYDFFKKLPSLYISISPYFYNEWVESASYMGLSYLYKYFNYDTEILENTKNKHKTNTNRNKDKLEIWLERIKKYIDLRDNDGWRNSFVFSGDQPNNGYKISPNEIQNLNSLPQPDLWCPIEIGDTTQSYLTPEWGSVIGIIDDNNKNKLLEIGRMFYNPNIDDEIKEVIEISKNLTIKEKLLAEFWAGGPFTITPPGFWIFFAIYCCYNNKISIKEEIELYLKLSSGLFQAGILAWKLKREYLQKRPIQSIRQLPSEEINYWNGSINSKLWMPYQEFNFVSPPFPDFISGHSTFSGIGSKILNEYFPPVGKLKIDGSLLKLLSPIFENHDITTGISELTIYPNSSQIQNNGGICLIYNSWDEMAEDAGLSRLYGGIHYMSSNLAGLAIGRNLINYIKIK
jgi:membrane-associated phospholipid phosphatase